MFSDEPSFFCLKLAKYPDSKEYPPPLITTFAALAASDHVATPGIDRREGEYFPTTTYTLGVNINF